MTPWMPSALWIERSEAESDLARRLRARLPAVPLRMVDDTAEAEPAGDFAEGKRRLVVKRHRGTFLQHCPAGTPGLVCCNYLVVSFAANCPFDCSYCFLQDYLANNTAIKAFSNVGDGLSEIDAVLRAHPDRTFRIGTGELADSLALDHLTDLSRELVPFFAERPNGLLELKTKSTGVDNLLDLDPKERTVVSWSLNATRIMATEEDGTASLEERLHAARRVQAAGYRVGFHFDPIIAHEGWEDGYRQVIERVFRRLDTRRVAWVSLGSLRMTPGLKAAIKARPNPSLVLTGELVPGPDGKERAWRGLRVKIYRRMLDWLQQIDARMPVYVCMEPPGVWSKVFGQTPSDREVAEQLVAQRPLACRVSTAR
ncbi:MAG: photolyase [Deltaproteobacteria bacterium]|nr:photolyase [Deltaproteobacteria bacterium]